MLQAQKIVVVGVHTADMCAFATKPLIRDLKGIGFPKDWTIVVACTPDVWERLRRKGDAFNTVTAFTYVESRNTVLNGAIYQQSLPLQGTVHLTPRSVLEHELGHILCNCDDEAKADNEGAKSEKAQRAAAKAEQPASSSRAGATAVSQHPLIAKAIAAAKARIESSKKCRRFFNYQGVEVIDHTGYYALDLGPGTVAAAKVGENIAVNINPKGAFMHPPAEFAGMHAAEDVRGFFILHELGHQLSQTTKFEWDHSEIKSLNDFRHDLNNGRLLRNCY